MQYTYIPYDKNLTTAIAHFVLTRIETQGKNGTVVIFDEIVDSDYIRLTFNEWYKILTAQLGLKLNTETYVFFKQRLDYDSIIDLTRFVNEYRKNNSEKNFLVLTQKSVLESPIPEDLSSESIKIGSYIKFDEFTKKLALLGYKRVDYVESIGEFAIRGSIIDIWHNGYIELISDNSLEIKHRVPVRIVLDEDKVVQIKQLDIVTQRSITKFLIDRIELFPVSLKEFFDEKDVANKHTLISLFGDKFNLLYCTGQVDMSNTLFEQNLPYFSTTQYYGDVEFFKKDLLNFIKNGYSVLLGYSYEYELQKLKEIISTINSLDLEKNVSIKFVNTKLTKGFSLPSEKFLFTTYSEIFSKYDAQIYTYSAKKVYHGIRLENIWEIQPEDYVVHRDYGIAKFKGVKLITLGDINKEFLELHFRGDTILYVPITEIDNIEKYISLTEKPPVLSSLDRESWQRTVNRIKESIKEFIVHLYTLYTQRKKLPGISFLGDEKLENMFTETFEYEETEDQKNAILDVLSDMQKPYPMDRVIVGDVGFGKTEVALRATFRAVLNKKQVLVLCPTTVLAEQHYRTFTERLSPFGIKTAVVTRLQSKDEIAKTLKDLAEGKVDVVIGTHILLKDEVKFVDLGLVIIDEEHKFGVKQKEKIRTKYRMEILNGNIDKTIPDTISLTATPIPRTLAFGLEGIKDISVIETPPEGRLPIETFVLPYDENVILEAINYELYRDGQVYYVFNNIQLIKQKTERLKIYFPSVNIEFIHSKLPSRTIEDVMIRFLNQEIKILVTTTIIEAGLDIPNVNTIIIENVENYGLAQLYQLRGRVGRRTKKAYCYMFYSPENLTLNAKKRLAAIIEFTSLGSGYRLALRDLEIRGAGEILGTKQHGFVNEVGLSMYSKIVQQIVSELSGKMYEELSPKIEIDIEAGFPDDYIENSETRIMFYRKLLEAQTFSQIDNVVEEIYDRFGKPKDPKHKILIENLLLLCKLRVTMKKYKIQRIYTQQDKLMLETQSSSFAYKVFKELQKTDEYKLQLENSIIAVSMFGRQDMRKIIRKFVSLLVQKNTNIEISTVS
ncbi:MAG: helicase-related protein [Endomicrobia bacterium]|nr:helicase-related protein [Endomicrobiia bacterium]